MKTLGVVNQKGGVGKTTTTFHIGTALAPDIRVLMIDMDPQGGLTYMATGKDPDEYELTIADVLLGEIPITEAIIPLREKLDLVPANIFLSGVEAQLINKIQRELRLKNVLKNVADRYDFIIIDTPPSLGLLTINTLFASDGMLIPVEAKLMGLRGMAILQNLLADIKNNVEGFDIEIVGVLPTFYDKRTTLSREVLSEIREVFGSKVKVLPPIKMTTKLAETPAFNIPVYERPETKGSDVAQTYFEIAKEVEKWLKS